MGRMSSEEIRLALEAETQAQAEHMRRVKRFRDRLRIDELRRQQTARRVLHQKE